MRCLLGLMWTISMTVGCGDGDKEGGGFDTGPVSPSADADGGTGSTTDADGGADDTAQSDSGGEAPADTGTPSDDDTAGADTGADSGDDTAEPDTGADPGDDTAAADTGADSGDDTAALDTGSVLVDPVEDPPEDTPAEPVVPLFDYEVVYHSPDFVYAEESLFDQIFATPVDWDADGDGDLVIFNDWTGAASVSYQSAPRTFDPPTPISNPLTHAIDELSAHHDYTFTSTNVSVVRTTPIQVGLDGAEGVLVQMQVARGSSWLAPPYDPVVLATAEGNTLLTTEPTSGARVLSDLNGDGLPEVLLGYKDGGADILWNADPDRRTPVPLDVHFFLKWAFEAEVAVTSPEDGEFILYTGGIELPSRQTMYRMHADEVAVTVLEMVDIGYVPTLVVANPDEPAPQSIFTTHYENPVTRFSGGEGVVVTADRELDGVTRNPTRYAQLDLFGGYDLMEMNILDSIWLVWLDNLAEPRVEGPLVYTGSRPGAGESDDDMFIRDLDGDNRADIIKCHVSEENYYQRIWWNNTE